MIFILKTLAAGVLISLASWVAGRKPILAGFIIALPLTSILGILFSYAEYRDMQKINQFASSVFIAVPLSLTFFILFLLNRWLKMSFPATFALGILFLALSYYVVCTRLKVAL